MLRISGLRKRFTLSVIAELFNAREGQILVHFLGREDLGEERFHFLCVNGVSYRIVMEEKGRFIKAKENLDPDGDYEDEDIYPRWVRAPIKLVECELPEDVRYGTSMYYDFDFEISGNPTFLASRLLNLTREELTYCFWLDRKTVIL